MATLLCMGIGLHPSDGQLIMTLTPSNVEFIDDSKFKPKAEAEMILEIGLVEANSCARHFHHDHLQPLQLLQPLQPLQRLIQDSDVPYLHYSGLY